MRDIDGAQFFLEQLKSLPKQSDLDMSDFKKGIFSLQVRQARTLELCGQVSRHFLLCA